MKTIKSFSYLLFVLSIILAIIPIIDNTQDEYKLGLMSGMSIGIATVSFFLILLSHTTNEK